MASFIIKFVDGKKQIWHILTFHELTVNMKSILTWNITEVVDEIEKRELESASIGSVQGISFLNECYEAAS